jgi:hypothetical protein
MTAVINLLSIVVAFALTIWLVRMPEKRFVKPRETRRFTMSEFRVEFPYHLWLVPVVGILQLVFGLGTLFLFTQLFGRFFSGAEPRVPSQLILAMLPLFFLGFLFPVGVIEMLRGMSIGFWGGKGTSSPLLVWKGDGYRKCGLVRVISYLTSLVIVLSVYLVFKDY